MSSFIVNILAAFLGFLAGQATAWRRHGSLIVPFTRPLGPRTNQIIGGALLLVMFLTAAQNIYVQNQQSNCNDQQRRVQAIRSDFTTRQAQAGANLQRELINIPGLDPASLEKRKNARITYVHTMDALDTEKARNPYPDPQCP